MRNIHDARRGGRAQKGEYNECFHHRDDQTADAAHKVGPGANVSNASGGQPEASTVKMSSLGLTLVRDLGGSHSAARTCNHEVKRTAQENDMWSCSAHYIAADMARPQ